MSDLFKDLSQRLINQISQYETPDSDIALIRQQYLQSLQSSVNAPANTTLGNPTLTVQGAATTGGASQAGGDNVNQTPTGSGTVQISADPQASLPVLYGEAAIRGVIIDATYSNATQQLYTAIALAETPGDEPEGILAGNITCKEVYFNDAKLNLNANGTVANAVLNDGTVTTALNDSLFVSLYKGSANIGNIAPGVPSAFASIPGTYIPGIGQLRGVLYAIVGVKYDAANVVQGLGTWTFVVDNGMNNPGNVVYDYLTNGRYGFGYDANIINANSITGNTDSIASASDEYNFFTTTNVSLANANAVSTIVTEGNIDLYDNFVVGTYNDGTANIEGNLLYPGNLTIDTTNIDITAGIVNRFKVFWAYGDGGNADIALYGANKLKGFVDVARMAPEGYFVDRYPGDIYNEANALTGSNTIVVPSITPNTSITNFLVEGDRIRPEGSRYIYTVAANVDVPSPGYEEFDIPVKERVIAPDFSDPANMTLNDPRGYAAGVAYSAETQDPDVNGILFNGGWPFENATANGAVRFPNQYTTYSNLIYSNVVVGNAVLSTPHETQGGQTYIGADRRARINGLINTTMKLSDNLNRILNNSQAFLTWDSIDGEWRGIPNAVADTANAFVFTDDNIVSELQVSTNSIEENYNSAKARYVERNQGYTLQETIVATPDVNKSPSEPLNRMELDYTLTNNAPEATEKARVELAQNRLDIVLSFTADYSAANVRPGDIVKVTNSVYGFNEKTFRVIRAVHDMGGDILTVNFVLTEWDAGIFDTTIPFERPELDIIQFDPEEFQNLDGGAIKANSITADALAPGVGGGGGSTFVVDGLSPQASAIAYAGNTASTGAGSVLWGRTYQLDSSFISTIQDSTAQYWYAEGTFNHSAMNDGYDIVAQISSNVQYSDNTWTNAVSYANRITYIPAHGANISALDYGTLSGATQTVGVRVDPNTSKTISNVYIRIKAWGDDYLGSGSVLDQFGGDTYTTSIRLTPGDDFSLGSL